MNDIFTLGIDFGSNSVRLLVADLSKGKVVASVAENYRNASQGVYYDNRDENVARQDPGDYLDSMVRAMLELKKNPALAAFNWQNLKGIGIDTTGSTPIPITQEMEPLANQERFRNNLNAKAWMWKDHTSEKEAQQITRLAQEMRPEFLKTCGGKYSSEWFWAKIMHCAAIDEEVYDAAFTWVEFSDFIPAVLTGIAHAGNIKRNLCAAGHKALYNSTWGGYPDLEFIQQLNPSLEKVWETLPKENYGIDQVAGYLVAEWAEKLGLPEGIPVAMGALDAHVGAIGSGVNEHTLVKIIGTSSCDIIVGNINTKSIPGVSGVAEHSVLPGYAGIEAGQSAVGDIFKWFVVNLLGQEESYHTALISQGTLLKPGESGLLALDWNNGNRDVLSDPELRGLILGQSLQTKDFEMYRALIEATAYGAKRIIDQLEANGVAIDRIICCGGIPQKNPLFMQIYADVLNRPIYLSESNETVALGAAMMGCLVTADYQYSMIELQKRFSKVSSLVYRPVTQNVNVYKELYKLFVQLHDAFGLVESNASLFTIMKQLIQIKNKVIKS
jgi:L-ribulokinase